MLRLVSPNLSTRESFLPSARAAPKQQTNVADLLIAVCKVRHTVTCTVLAAPLLASGLTERFCWLPALVNRLGSRPMGVDGDT